MPFPVFDDHPSKERFSHIKSEPNQSFSDAALNHSHTPVSGYKGKEVSLSLSILPPQEAVANDELILQFPLL